MAMGSCGVSSGSGRERPGRGRLLAPSGVFGETECDMPEVYANAALIAGQLALGVGNRAVVCLNCPLSGEGHATALFALSPTPFGPLPLAPGRLLLVGFMSRAVDLVRLRSCACAAIPEVWLLDPDERSLERLSHPRDGFYRRRSLILEGERVALAALPTVRLTPLPRIARSPR